MTLSVKEINKLAGTSILELAQQLEDVLTHELVHEDTSVLDFIKNYFNE
jgi:hypothetical protein